MIPFQKPIFFALICCAVVSCGDKKQLVTPVFETGSDSPAREAAVNPADVPLLQPVEIDRMDISKVEGAGGGVLQASNGYLFASAWGDNLVIPFTAEGKFGQHKVFDPPDLALARSFLDASTPPKVWTAGGFGGPGWVGVHRMGPPFQWNEARKTKIPQDWRLVGELYALQGGESALVSLATISPEDQDANFPVPESRWGTEVFRVYPDGHSDLFVSAKSLGLDEPLYNLGLQMDQSGNDLFISAMEWGNGCILRMDPSARLLEKIQGPAGVSAFGSDFAFSQSGERILASAEAPEGETAAMQLLLGLVKQPRDWIRLQAPATSRAFGLNFGFLPTPDGEVIYVSSMASHSLQPRFDFYDPQSGKWIARMKPEPDGKLKYGYALQALAPGIYAALMSDYKANKVRVISLKCF